MLGHRVVMRAVATATLLGCSLGAFACGRVRYVETLSDAPDAGFDADPRLTDSGVVDASTDGAAGRDAFVSIDAVAPDAFLPVDAFAPDAFAPDTFAPIDAFVRPDAFVPIDAFSPSDAFVPIDAFVRPDAFVPIDAFVPPDAFVPIDAFVPPDADRSWRDLSPVSYYPFDGDTTNLVHLPSSIGSCGMCSYAAGHQGDAIFATGTSALDRPELSTGDFTVSFWVRPPAVLGGGFSACGAFRGSGLTTFEVGGGGALSLYHGAVGGRGVSASAGVWHHVLLTYFAASSEVRLMVDMRSSITLAIPSPESLRTFNLGAGVCDVPVDDLFFFDRVLSEPDIVWLATH